jgi:hypothetical protein
MDMQISALHFMPSQCRPARRYLEYVAVMCAADDAVHAIQQQRVKLCTEKYKYLDIMKPQHML